MTTLVVPKGLSRKSAKVWHALTTLQEFEAHELVAFERSLQWDDRSAALWRRAARTTGRQQAGLMKLAMDASTCSLRYWRLLKFTDDQVATRRPGRPSDANWSAQRRAQTPRIA